MPKNTSNRIETQFLAAIQESYRRTQSGPTANRSKARLKVLHGWVQQEISDLLGADYDIHGLSDAGGKEEKVAGWYYRKNVDVAVKRDDKVLGVVSIKFVNTNFRQNAGNYFEGQMGETANLRRNDIVFGSIFCVTHPILYLDSKRKIARMEHINNTDIEKYHKLERDHNHRHAPDVQALCVLKLDWEKKKITGICERKDLDHLDDDAYNKLKSMNISRFFEMFCGNVELKHEFLQNGG